MNISGLLVDDLVEPHDIGLRPSFSWRMEGDRPGAAQSAYRIKVWNPAFPEIALLWDSGVVEDPHSVDIPYVGAPLAEATRYAWSVEVRDEIAEWLPAATGTFSTGFFGTASWQGSIWISAADYPENSLATATFAKRFRNAKPISEAWWCCTGLGVFEARVNGVPYAPDAFLKPGFTSSTKTKFSFCRDITALLRCGAGEENELSADLSTGWWCDEIMRGFEGRRPAFRAVLVLRHPDGTETRVATGTDWLAACDVGAITAASIYYGEDFDARLSCAATEPLRFAPAVENTEFQGDIVPMEGPPVCLREDLAMIPVAAWVWQEVTGADADHYGTVVKLRSPLSTRHSSLVTRHSSLSTGDGSRAAIASGETLVLDFGQNCAAVPEFVFRAARGTTLSAHPAEMLNDGNGAKSRGCDGPEGAAYLANYRIARATARYTFAGNGVERYRPSFTFFGGRYLTIAADGPVEITSVRWIPVCSIPAESETSAFDCGEPTLNRFALNALWGQRSNYLSVPTDCPQRDERCGWTADTLVFAKAACYNADVRGFLRKWLHDLRDAQRDDGAYPGAAPLASHGARFHQFGWGDAGILVPHLLWRHYGDRRAVEEHWGSMVRFMELVDGMEYASPEALDHQWADWLSCEEYETKSGKAYVTGKNNTPPVKPEALLLWRYLGTCHWLLDAEAMADMAGALPPSPLGGAGGNAPRPFAAMAARARAALRERFTDPADGMLPSVFRSMQTPALFALRLGILDPEPARRTREALLANIREHGFRVQTGFLGTAILMDTLCDVCGAPEVAYSLMLNHGFPGWLYSVDQGATTVWERWNSYTRADGLGDVAMNSFNHYAYGAVFAWMMRTMAGIREDPAEPGFRRFILAPVPDRRLGGLSARYRSPYGTIESAWRYGEDGACRYDFTLPPNTEAVLRIPGLPDKVFFPGSHTVAID